MFFKNIFVFAFTRPFTTTNEELIDALTEHTFMPLGSTEMVRMGWSTQNRPSRPPSESTIPRRIPASIEAQVLLRVVSLC